MSAAQDLNAIWGRNAAQRQQPEAALQRAVAEYLQVALPPNAVAHHSPGEGKRSKRAQGELKQSGFLKGWPDIEIIFQGRAYFIELKSATGRVPVSQRETHRKLMYCGAAVMVCRSVPEVEAALRDACVPLRATVAA